MVIKTTSWLYLEPLLFNDDWVHLSNISGKIGKNHTVVRQHLGKFEEMGVVKKMKMGGLSLYKINLEYSLIIDVLTLVEKERIINKRDNLIIKELIESLHKKIPANYNIIIFGSSVDNSKKSNDVDLLIDCGNLKLDFEKLEKNINKKIHLIKVSSLDEVSSTLKNEIRKTHLIVQGSEEIIRWLI